MLYRINEDGSTQIRLERKEVAARRYAKLVMDHFDQTNDLLIEKFYPVEVVDGISYMKYEAFSDHELDRVTIYMRQVEAPYYCWCPTAAEHYGLENQEDDDVEVSEEDEYYLPPRAQDDDFFCFSTRRTIFEWWVYVINGPTGDPIIVDLPDMSDEEFAAHTRMFHEPAPGDKLPVDDMRHAWRVQNGLE